MARFTPAMVIMALTLILLPGCPGEPPARNRAPVTSADQGKSAPAPKEDPVQAAGRRRMVELQLRGRDIRDERVLAVMGRVPRHLFVPEAYAVMAYEDTPLPIGGGQTISQPYIVALMTQEIHPKSTDRILEIGTGSGYQAAVLAELAGEVYTIELLGDLGRRAERVLKRLKYPNVHCRIGDGYQGWPEAAPFDAILVTAAAPGIPPRLVEQLKPGGVLVMPLGGQSEVQQLIRLDKQADGSTKSTTLIPVRFVPLVHPR